MTREFCREKWAKNGHILGKTRQCSVEYEETSKQN